jgi:hypothetical protein
MCLPPVHKVSTAASAAVVEGGLIMIHRRLYHSGDATWYVQQYPVLTTIHALVGMLWNARSTLFSSAQMYEAIR